MLARAPHLVPLALALGAPAAAQLPPGFQNQLVVSGLDSPVSIEFLPDGRALILEKDGTIRSLGPGATQLDPSPYLVLPAVEDGGERGLLDIAVDPAFAANGRFYLYYTNASSARNRVSRFSEVGGVGSLASETVLWEDNEPFSSCCHYGGGLDFGPDGNLWLTTGEELRASRPRP
jgi:glucose/arabinose dehydrogenase